MAAARSRAWRKARVLIIKGQLLAEINLLIATLGTPLPAYLPDHASANWPSIVGPALAGIGMAAISLKA